jgi:hypothetical protein
MNRHLKIIFLIKIEHTPNFLGYEIIFQNIYFYKNTVDTLHPLQNLGGQKKAGALAKMRN